MTHVSSIDNVTTAANTTYTTTKAPPPLVANTSVAKQATSSQQPVISSLKMKRSPEVASMNDGDAGAGVSKSARIVTATMVSPSNESAAGKSVDSDILKPSPPLPLLDNCTTPVNGDDEGDACELTITLTIPLEEEDKPRLRKLKDSIHQEFQFSKISSMSPRYVCRLCFHHLSDLRAYLDYVYKEGVKYKRESSVKKASNPVESGFLLSLSGLYFYKSGRIQEVCDGGDDVVIIGINEA